MRTLRQEKLLFPNYKLKKKTSTQHLKCIQFNFHEMNMYTFNIIIYLKH